jgi:ribosomal protein S7
MKFINCFTRCGKKEKVLNIFFKIFSNELHKNYISYFMFFESLEKFKPSLKVVPVRIKKEFYKIPVPVSPLARYKLATRYFYRFVKSEEFERVFANKIRNQLMTIFYSGKLAVPELDFIKKSSIKNRMFMHYRWH